MHVAAVVFVFFISISMAERTKSLKAAKEKSELDLKDSQERFRAMVETSYDIFWETDRNGNFSYISPNIKEILGFDPGDLFNKKIHSVFVPESDQSFPDPFNDKDKNNTRLKKDLFI